jgi:hypothetical protein
MQQEWKEQSIRIEINTKATRKIKFEQSRNNDRIHQEQNVTRKTAENKATEVCTITEPQEATVRIKPKKQAPRPPLKGN